MRTGLGIALLLGALLLGGCGGGGSSSAASSPATTTHITTGPNGVITVNGQVEQVPVGARQHCIREMHQEFGNAETLPALIAQCRNLPR